MDHISFATFAFYTVELRSNTANIFLLPTFQNFRPGSVKEASHLATSRITT